MAEKKENKKEEQPRFILSEVATQTQPIIYDTKTETQYDLYSAVAKMMNDIEDIKERLEN